MNNVSLDKILKIYNGEVSKNVKNKYLSANNAFNVGNNGNVNNNTNYGSASLVASYHSGIVCLGYTYDKYKRQKLSMSKSQNKECIHPSYK